ncbi:NUDIX domain-containing protein [Kitasatospora cineracea]|uniref:Nudix hydrolase domain-containing protein n=1 Tax=Kitasatospora cineracea TaxID=88074 RepID=A0A8G1XDZ5_9ACTN|nr:hypothetical protein EDD39_4652 [Kitasatospora cineracea]
MATPQFILDLRKHIGHGPLWLSGVTAVVIDDERILLNRRSDTGRWALLHGILEPGEQPSGAVVREPGRPSRCGSGHLLTSGLSG